MRRSLLPLLHLFALVSILAAAACSPTASPVKNQATATPLPAPVAATKQTYKVQRGDVTEQIQFSARVIPGVQEELYFRTDGRVRYVNVRAGDTVTKGQVLADLLQLNQLEAQKTQQDLNLRKAQINLEMAWLRQQQWATRTPDLSSTYDIDAKMQQYELELAQIALEETKLNSTNLETSIADAQIVSPIDGKALTVSLMEGSDVRSFTSAITVGDDSTVVIGASLTANQMQLLTEGLPALFELPSRPGEKLNGKLISLPYPYGTGGGEKAKEAKAAGTSTDNTARLVLNDPAQMKTFKLGDLVTATILIQNKQNVLWLPPAAIRTYEGRNFVVVKTENEMTKRADIKVGIKNEERVEILSGLEEGQVVVAP